MIVILLIAVFGYIYGYITCRLTQEITNLLTDCESRESLLDVTEKIRKQWEVNKSRERVFMDIFTKAKDIAAKYNDTNSMDDIMQLAEDYFSIKEIHVKPE